MKLLKNNDLEDIERSLQVANALVSYSLFEGLSLENGVGEELGGLFLLKKFHPGDRVLQEGDEGSEIFLLCEGSIRVLKTTLSGEEYGVADLSANDKVFFGEMSLLTSENRSASILALTEVECLVTDREAFDAFAKKHPHAALVIIQRIVVRLSDRLRRATEDSSILYQALVEEIAKEANG